MKELVKKVARRLPPVAAAYWKLWGMRFPGTRAYWEKRYRAGGSSGPGSYGRLAHFKAEDDLHLDPAQLPVEWRA